MEKLSGRDLLKTSYHSNQDFSKMVLRPVFVSMKKRKKKSSVIPTYYPVIMAKLTGHRVLWKLSEWCVPILRGPGHGQKCGWEQMEKCGWNERWQNGWEYLLKMGIGTV
jgi:hypothetical protein